MKKLIFIGFLTNLLIYALANGESESNISESINAILVKCPKHSANKSCESQLIINIHMNPSFDVGNLEKFWMLDEVYDPSKRSNIKIISPYLIVVSRGEPIVMYPLQFIKSIDQDETEQSFSEDAKLPTNKEDNEIENSLRLKRSQRPKASRGTLKNSKNVFGGKRHDMDAFHSHNPRQPDFSNLGLVRVMDKSLKNNSFDNFDIPTDFNYEPRPYGQHMQEHYNKPISHSTYFKGPYNFNKQKIVDQSRIMDDFMYKKNMKDLEKEIEYTKPNQHKSDRNRQYEKAFSTDFSSYDQSSHLGDKGKYCPEVNEDLNYKSNPNSFPNMEEEENEHVDYKSQLNRYSDSNEFPEEKENLNYKPLLKTYPNINDFPEEREYLKYNSPMRSSPNINEYPQEMEYGNNFNNDPSQSKSNNNFKLQPRMNKLPPMKIRNEIKIPNEMDTKFSQNGISKNVFLHGKENEKVEFRRPVNRLSLSNDFLPARGRFNFKDNPNRHSDINNYPQERESKKYNLNANANADSNEKYFYHQKENKENNVNANGNGNANANDIPPAKEGENENINMHEQETMNEIPQEEVPENNPERPPVNDYPLGQPDVGSLEAIAKHHFTENLENERHLNVKNKIKAQEELINHYYLPDQYHPYSVFVPNYKKNGFVNYPNNHNYRPYRRYKNKRMKRSSPQVHNSENQDDSRLAIDPLKGYNLERVLDNGEASCDTCGGKNKKKGGKPGSRYCAPLVTSRNRPEKIEEVNPKLDEESPCDTCGGKNKKPGGKTLPSGLESANSEDFPNKLDEESPCDTCGGKNKKPGGKSLPGCPESGNIQEFHLKLDEESPCDTCGGKNKKPGGKSLPSSLESQGIQDAHPKIDEESPCDTCGGKNKKPGGKTLPIFQQPEQIDEFNGNFKAQMPFDAYEEINKKPGEKSLPRVLLSREMEDINHKILYGGFSPIDMFLEDKQKTEEKEILEDPDAEKIQDAEKINDEAPCDTCGGKNKKPGGKSLPVDVPFGKMESLQPQLNEKTPYGEINKDVGENSLPTDLGSEIHVENSQDAIPCERCKGLDKCNDGKLISQSCGCVGNPDVCDCDSSKSSRASANTDSIDSLNNAGYSVFNMNNPVPLLTTKLKIFRRRHNTWWRIIPVITLNSMDGIYANENLSVVFSSHVDILRMEKSLGFLNSKLVIPKLKDEQKHTDTVKEFLGNIGNSVFLDSSSKDISMREIKSSMISNLKNKEKNEGLPIKSIDGLGNFPASMEALMKCPHKDNKLCLNVLDKKVPEFSLKVKIPFRENGLVQRNKYTVKIARIVTDATTKNALQIFIDVINKGFQAQIFSIYVCNCEQTFSSSTTPSVKKLLLPQIGQTVIFLLPLTRGFKKNSKFSCDVIVKATAHHNQKRDDFKTDIVAKRSLDIKVHSRCFCVWRCQCHCMGKLETFVDYNVCERMGHKSAEEAGLLYNCAPGNEKNDICIMDIQNAADEEDQCDTLCNIISIALFILLFLFLLGVWKAVLGFCFRSIGECGFSTVQPGRKYACTSKGRIFFVNVFFFILFPFSFWCKCFRPRLEDLMAASTEWSCHPQSDDDCENSCTKSDSDTHYRLHGGQDPQINERLMLAFAPLHENGLFKDEKPEDEESTAFILEVLEESKHSLSKMMSQTVENISKTETKCEESSDVEEADELIDSLKNAQVVYRTMSTPVGGVIDIPENCKYCVKGFFLPTINSTYEFISYHPLTQYWGITEENESRKLAQPRYIHTDGFSRTYNTKVEVFKAADLSVVCPIKVPCINIDELNYLENSFVKLSTQQELIKAHQS